MITTAIRKKFMEYPVIAAVRTPEDFEAAFHSKVKIIFMVGGLWGFQEFSRPEYIF